MDIVSRHTICVKSPPGRQRNHSDDRRGEQNARLDSRSGGGQWALQQVLGHVDEEDDQVKRARPIWPSPQSRLLLPLCQPGQRLPTRTHLLDLDQQMLGPAQDRAGTVGRRVHDQPRLLQPPHQLLKGDLGPHARQRCAKADMDATAAPSITPRLRMFS